MTVQIPDPDVLWQVMPEIWLVLAMCGVILVPFVKRTSVALPTAVALAGLVLALVCSRVCDPSGGPGVVGSVLFDGMLTVDPFAQFFKLLLLVFTILVVVQWLIVGRSRMSVYDVPDFFCLLLGATLGMAMMASASNLLMIFIAMELASMPSFVLAGFRKKARVGSEGALKYVIFGAASSAVMLYGMSLVYGCVGTLDLGGVTAEAAKGMSPLFAVGLLAMFAGLAFKLSAVPLHFWCPDVFEGAPIEVTTFLSVASKGAALCLLLRVLHSFSAASGGVGLAGGEPLFQGLAVGIGILGAITATWGNLVALHQTNIKRLLAYSSIAHAGYMIMAVSVVAIAGLNNPGPGGLGNPGGAVQGVAGALLFYLIIYLFMNLGAFTVAGLVAQATGCEDLRDYTGLIRRSPALAVLLSVFLLSLFGMPGLGGFAGKIYLMKSMADAAGGWAFALIAVLLVNTLISLYYYLRPVYFMVFASDEESRPGFLPRPAGAAMLVVCALMLLWTGLYPPTLADMAWDHAYLYTSPVQSAQDVSSQDRSTASLQLMTTPPGALEVDVDALSQMMEHQAKQQGAWTLDPQMDRE